MQDFRSYSNEQLFELLKCSDEGAFAEIFSRYDRRIYRFIHKMVKDNGIATDVTQEVFIRIWTKREQLAEVHNMEAYIFTIASNLTLNQIKKRLRERQIREKLQSQWRQNKASDADNLLLLHDCETLVARVVEQLPPQQKRIYRLSREEGLNYEEISQTMKISPNTVRNHLVKALQTIRIYIEKQGQIFHLLFILLYFHQKN
ncbi:MAG TPA: RNA polymerase sigma-70 factor [Arachidicoccus sp.]|nr:RNA polymerase sigma-70 factor [Arachidicoccus sp.]